MRDCVFAVDLGMIDLCSGDDDQHCGVNGVGYNYAINCCQVTTKPVTDCYDMMGDKGEILKCENGYSVYGACGVFEHQDCWSRLGFSAIRCCKTDAVVVETVKIRWDGYAPGSGAPRASPDIDDCYWHHDVLDPVRTDGSRRDKAIGTCPNGEILTGLCISGGNRDCIIESFNHSTLQYLSRYAVAIADVNPPLGTRFFQTYRCCPYTLNQA